MSIRRQQIESFSVPVQTAAAAVRAVLSRRLVYRHTSELENGTVFKTNVKPSWWLLGTDLTINLQPLATGTQIVAETQSQWFIFGDAFDYYNGYLRNFFSDVRAELLSHAPA